MASMRGREFTLLLSLFDVLCLAIIREFEYQYWATFHRLNSNFHAIEVKDFRKVRRRILEGRQRELCLRNDRKVAASAGSCTFFPTRQWILPRRRRIVSSRWLQTLISGTIFLLSLSSSLLLGFRENRHKDLDRDYIISVILLKRFAGDTDNSHSRNLSISFTYFYYVDSWSRRKHETWDNGAKTSCRNFNALFHDALRFFFYSKSRN